MYVHFFQKYHLAIEKSILAALPLFLFFDYFMFLFYIIYSIYYIALFLLCK